MSYSRDYFLVLLNATRPPCASLALLGAGAHAIHLYYWYTRSLVIQRHCNRGAKGGGAKPLERFAFFSL
jgi:hypothetical protein